MITIQQAPEDVAPVYNPLKHVLTSTNYTQPNFRYVCDIYVNGGSDYIERQKIPADPIYGSCVFDPSRILEAYVTKDFDVNNVASFNCANSVVTYIIKFGEEYGLSSSGTTVYPNQTIQGKKYAWNGIFDYEDFCSVLPSEYVSGDSTKNFLTNAPNYKEVYIDSTYLGGNEFIYGINNTSGDIYYLKVGTQDSSGLGLGVYLIKNNYQALSNDNQKIVGFPCGANMNNISASEIVVSSGSLPIITSNVVRYSVQAVNFFGTVKSEVKYFDINRDCTRYQLYEVYFLNKLGGYDTFTFNKKSTFKSDIKRETYRKNLGELTSATAYTYSVNQRSNVNYATNIEDTITLRSDYIDEETMLWLEELVTSPDVYILSQDLNDHIPVTITSSSFERKKDANEKLFNLTIDIKLSYKRKRQRG